MNIRPWRMPRTLFGRNLLLIGMLILFAELGMGLFFHAFVQKPRFVGMVNAVAMHVTTLRLALEKMPAEQRPRFMESLESANTQTYIGDQPEIASSVQRPLVEFFSQALTAQLGPGYRVAWQEAPQQRLWIGVLVEGNTHWFGLSGAAFVANRGYTMLAMMLGTGLAALFGAMLIQRHVNQPLRILSEAAAKLGYGTRKSVQIPDAPLEIAQVADSFNRMLADLEAAESERALMLAGVSHDLRTPLTKLRLAAEILGNDEKPDPELIAGMNRNIAVADAIIGQFIDFARQGNDEAVSTCDLNEIARDVASTTPAGNVQLELRQVPPLPCRPVALRRAISNLIDNALRYGPKDCGKVILRTQQCGNTVQIAVLDQGPGIPEGQQAYIRQPFARLEAARGLQPGTGLGLAIVECIVRQHGGELLIENRPEGGLMVTLKLPVGEE